MKASLAGPSARIRLSETHIQALDASLGDFFKRHPHKVSVEKNNDTGKCDAIIRGVPAIPPDYAIYAGMIAHNLRATLDGLACQLAIRHAVSGSMEEICSKVSFPIFLNGPGSACKPRFDPSDGRIRPLGRFIAAIEKMQPYQSGEGGDKNILWVLQSLNNTDKHRVLVLFVASVGTTRMNLSVPPGQVDIGGGMFRTLSPVPHEIFSGRPFVDGTKVAEFDTASPSDVDVQFDLMPSVCFGDGCSVAEGIEVIPALQRTAAYIRRIVESFSAEF